MMSVKILGFGLSWWARFGRHPGDPWRFTRHAAYYNSAGVRCGNKIRRHWIVPGLVRFNGVVEFDLTFPLDRLVEPSSALLLYPYTAIACYWPQGPLSRASQIAISWWFPEKGTATLTLATQTPGQKLRYRLP